MIYENLGIGELIRFACLKYLGNPPELQNAAVNDLIRLALIEYLNAGD